ncbi:MAG: hypothetical protein WC346_05030 [Methanogenium sp.]|jgi:hypothetical protein
MRINVKTKQVNGEGWEETFDTDELRKKLGYEGSIDSVEDVKSLMKEVLEDFNATLEPNSERTLTLVGVELVADWKERVLKALSDAQLATNIAFGLLTSKEQNTCSYFAGLTCEIDEAIAEVEKLQA